MMRFLAALAALLISASCAAAAEAPWIDDAVVYGVIPSLLGPRGLAGVTDRLDWIAGLGATVIWLSPITDAPPGDFGYAVTDHFRIRPALGGDEDLRKLVASAHARGLKVILDVPANDLSDRHPFYRDALRRGAASPYYAYFARDARGAATHYFDWTHLENLNYDDPAVRAYGIAIFAHWLQAFDVDGFRVDAAWGPRQRSPDFWPAWATALRRIKPDILLLAEASERDPYYAATGFDAAYDWTGKPGEWAWADAFGSRAPAARLRAALARENDDAPIFRFLDDNDTGARFITRHGIGMTRVAAAMLMTLPGLPCLYMGEETGAEFEPYAATAPIDWQDRQGLSGYVRRLISVRHAQAALRTRKMTLLAVPHDDTVLAYLRPGISHETDLLVLLNYGGTDLDEAMPADAALRGVLGTGAVTDLLSGERLVLAPGGPAISLPALSARVLRRAPAL